MVKGVNTIITIAIIITRRPHCLCPATLQQALGAGAAAVGGAGRASARRPGQAGAAGRGGAAAAGAALGRRSVRAAAAGGADGVGATLLGGLLGSGPARDAPRPPTPTPRRPHPLCSVTDRVLRIEAMHAPAGCRTSWMALLRAPVARASPGGAVAATAAVKGQRPAPAAPSWRPSARWLRRWRARGARPATTRRGSSWAGCAAIGWRLACRTRPAAPPRRRRGARPACRPRPCLHCCRWLCQRCGSRRSERRGCRLRRARSTCIRAHVMPGRGGTLWSGHGVGPPTTLHCGPWSPSTVVR